MSPKLMTKDPIFRGVMVFTCFHDVPKNLDEALPQKRWTARDQTAKNCHHELPQSLPYFARPKKHKNKSIYIRLGLQFTFQPGMVALSHHAA